MNNEKDMFNKLPTGYPGQVLDIKNLIWREQTDEEIRENYIVRPTYKEIKEIRQKRSQLLSRV
jgi:hypothetical protein